MDDAGDSRGDSRWVSYAELALIRGITRDSAIRLVRRERWRKLPGNAGGSVRILVPDAWLQPALGASSPDRGGQIPGDPGGDPGGLRGLLAGWQQALELARIRAEAEVIRADRAEARAKQAEQDRRGAETRADCLRERLEAAQLEAAELRQREAQWWSRGRLARLWAAWRSG